MGCLMDSKIRLCSHTCALPHTYQYRQHLPLALLRVTHDGSADGRIAPTPRPDADNTIWPRYRGQRIIPPGEVACHMNRKSRFETQFSSCTTWFHLSSRIEGWKAKGVRNLRVHVIFTPFVRQATEIYKVTGLVHRFNLQQQPYFEEEYLVRGPVHSSAIILSFSGEGENILLNLPLFGFQRPFSFIRHPTVLVAVPAGLFGSNGQTPGREAIRNADISSDRFRAMGNNNFWFRVLLDTFTRGKFFTVADWKAASSP
ncbi:hypothetical protein ASPSYDRAFT_52532 [Aspergillus sydowii CBS 593.65]|uniref:Uncharacterized protein n=1 Tax=Aspergillus sydowii CBS 593.65 TaxID=1036612 RepID=A0A1L9SXT1_9EURO|nr:uncharacterized protein ASPSYDRAFT_52532 [Aspergillus sydowii CBS 593.65]OJJ52032.1 hypothetical protein ASPSYDRAFT_52532 [Aspergillus sydowii CBS 593.65]